MDLLVVEPLESEVMQWLESRHAVRFAPELAREPRALRQSLYNVRAVIVPPSAAIDAQALHYAPMLRAVGRVSAGAENIDLDACARAGVEVVRSLTASAQAEAEFMIGALLSMLRRVPVVGSDGMLVGRELGAAELWPKKTKGDDRVDHRPSECPYRNDRGMSGVEPLAQD